MADKQAVVKDTSDKPVQAKAEKTFYFKNPYYSGLKILIRGGAKDVLGGEGVKEEARFKPYYDVFKGDIVKVGYLETTSEEVAERCRADNWCEELTKKEYDLELQGDGDKRKPLRPAPIPIA